MAVLCLWGRLQSSKWQYYIYFGQNIPEDGSSMPMGLDCLLERWQSSSRQCCVYRGGNIPVDGSTVWGGFQPIIWLHCNKWGGNSPVDGSTWTRGKFPFNWWKENCVYGGGNYQVDVSTVFYGAITVQEVAVLCQWMLRSSWWQHCVSWVGNSP